MGELNKQEKRVERLKSRNEAIKKAYEKLSNKKYKGVRVYSEDVKMTMLADQFFLSEVTIEDIIYNRIKY